MGKPLDGDEEALAGLLARAGFSVPAARAFAALARGGGHTASDLAAAIGSTRQEAGDAARALELHGLARVEKLKTGGRPAHRYHLVPEGVGAFVRARREALREEIAMLDAVERRFLRAAE